MKDYYVYILTNHTNRTLYVGVTNNLTRRTYEHKQAQNSGFAEKYHCYKLIYYELHANIDDAIKREKQLKRWSRMKKEALVNNMNPDWKDLFED